MTLRLGTRRSALALAQSGQIARAITALSGVEVELVPLVTEGDVSRASLSSLGGTGVFATRLREALHAGQCDLLVHSLKDLPTAPAPGLRVAGIPVREDARDLIVTRGPRLQELESTAVIGTGSPRRIAQVRGRNPRVQISDLRGNVDSRLARVRDGELDAVVLAAAGLTRLGVIDESALPVEGGPAEGLVLEAMGQAEWPTAAGQGALAVEIMEDAPAEVVSVVEALDHAPTRWAVTAERALLSTLEAGCHAPVGAHAEVTGDEIRLRAIVYGGPGVSRLGIDLTSSLREGYIHESGDANGAIVADGADPTVHAALLGSVVARRLLHMGAADLVPRESS